MRKTLFSLALLLLLIFLSAEIINPETYALRVHDEVNESRLRNGLPALIWLEDLAELAQLHSQNMGQKGFFSHLDPEGLRVSARQRKYQPQLLLSGIGENLYRSQSSSRVFDPKRSAQSWMNSPGHRENILNRNYSHSGIGVFLKGDRLYVTQVFATPILKLRTSLPPFFLENIPYLLEFEYLSTQPREGFISFLTTPDPNTRVDVGLEGYYNGSTPLTYSWTEDNTLLFPLEFNYGKGSYILKIGWDDYVYPDMMEFMVR